MPPISPMKDGATGKTVKSATLTPLRTLELNEVYQLITANKRLITLTQAIREAALQGDDNNCRMLKQQTLPYVTPCGVFTRRRSDCLKLPSGLVVVDVDHLDSPDEAGRLKQLLFKDPYLAPVLVFISPTGRGVKAFVPCPIGKDSTEAVRWDVNGDGKLNIMDILLAQRSILGLGKLRAEEIARADLNGNGKVDILDVLLMQKKILGL